MSLLESPQMIARMLLFLSYSEDTVRGMILAEFPATMEAELNAAIHEAKAHLARLDAEHEELLAREAAAARASELDLTKSMHDTEAK